MKLSAWLDKFDRRVEAVRDSVRDQLSVVQAQNKCLEQQKKLRTFSPGDKVLLRACGLPDKLAQAWEGPYVVKRRIGLVNYELDLGSRSKRLRASVVHVNNIKLWHEDVYSVNRVVLAQDADMDEEVPSITLKERELSPHQQQQISELQQKFKADLTTTPGIADVPPIQIDTGQHHPVSKAPYRIPDCWKADLRTHTSELRELGVILPSSSPWCSSSVTVGKSDGTLRLCQDYRPLNAITIPDPYQMKRVDDTLDLLGEAWFLTKLDLSKGYYQILVKESDVCKTAFSTPFGKFEYLRMPFGLRNAPSHFQRVMDVVLSECIDFSSSYIDDVVVFSKTWDDHLCHLECVLQALCSRGFTIKPSKCVWGAQSIDYLGYTVGEGQLSVPDIRVKSINAFSRPSTISQLRSFLGTIGYYRRFVPHFAKYSSSLTPATKSGMPKVISWSPHMTSAFHSLRSSLSDVVRLYIPCVTDEFVLITDACASGVGSVLCVVRSGCFLPVAFYSRQLRERESRYAATELEGLAVVESVKYFEIHLFGRCFVIYTDHAALTHLFSSSVLNVKLWRWALYLQQFSITFKHVPGSFNVVADCLSRQPWSAKLEDKDASTALPENVIHPGGNASTPPSSQQPVNDTAQKTVSQLKDVPSTFVGGDVGVITPQIQDIPT